MKFDTDNAVVKLCIQGIALEGEGKPGLAADIFQQAWDQSTNDLERFTSAHYMARHQPGTSDKLAWDQLALDSALRITTDDIKSVYPSLYLNIAKGYEDLNHHQEAYKHYSLALSFVDSLPDDGYGRMIKAGVMNGIARTTAHK